MFVGIANKFATFANTKGERAVVGPRNRYGEYVVGLYRNDILYKPATSYDHDLQSAIGTALAMVNN